MQKVTTSYLKSVNADFFESNMRDSFKMDKYAICWKGLYVFNGEDWDLETDDQDVALVQDAKTFLFDRYVRNR
jgi:glutamine cyclotransferase